MVNTEDMNIVMSAIIILAASAAAFVRENPSALDQLADWASSRSWGIKCARAEAERRKKGYEA